MLKNHGGWRIVLARDSPASWLIGAESTYRQLFCGSLIRARADSSPDQNKSGEGPGIPLRRVLPDGRGEAPHALSGPGLFAGPLPASSADPPTESTPAVAVLLALGAAHLRGRHRPAAGARELRLHAGPTQDLLRGAAAHLEPDGRAGRGGDALQRGPGPAADHSRAGRGAARPAAQDDSPRPSAASAHAGGARFLRPDSAAEAGRPGSGHHVSCLRRYNHHEGAEDSQLADQCPGRLALHFRLVLLRLCVSILSQLLPDDEPLLPHLRGLPGRPLPPGPLSPLGIGWV